MKDELVKFKVRRTLMKFIAAFTLAPFSGSYAACARSARGPIVGAIRWDAWYDPDGGVGRAVDESLGPNEFHDRMPFFGREISENAVRIDGNNQASFDQEILYARDLGLKYWAYCWYDDISTFQRAWSLHQKSSQASEMNWCMLWQLSHLGGPEQFYRNVSRYVKWLGEANYQKLNDRPLIYLLYDNVALGIQWEGKLDRLSKAIAYLRSSCQIAGIGSPFLVIMDSDPNKGAELLNKLKADAISNYISWVPDKLPAPFSRLTEFSRLFWNKLAETGVPIVPIIMTGWDPRPRKLHPPPWDSESPEQRQSTRNAYVIPGTSEEIDSAISAGKSYVEQHRTECPSNLLLIYSWDECDEGGGALISKSYLTSKNLLLSKTVNHRANSDLPQ